MQNQIHRGRCVTWKQPPGFARPQSPRILQNGDFLSRYGVCPVAVAATLQPLAKVGGRWSGPPAFLKTHVVFRPDDKVMDAGCGTGGALNSYRR